jgi:histidine triad (HIT) family protein
MADDCLFCKIVAGDIPADKVYEDDQVVVFKDIAPQAPIHLLVIPKKHIKGPAAAGPEDEALLGRLLRTGSQVAADQGIEDFRLVFNNGAGAGQTVFHIHLHVLGGRPMNWPPG